MPESIRARIVMAAERTHLAWAASVLGGLLAGYMLTFSSPGGFGGLARHFCALGILVWVLGPLLVWRSRPQRTTVQPLSSGIVVGDVTAARGSAVSVARAARGLSIAVETSAGIAFVEVETEEEARRITAWLGTSLAGAGELSRPMAHAWLRIATVVASILGLVPAVLFLLVIASGHHSNDTILVSVPLALASSALFVLSRWFKRPLTWGQDQVTLSRAAVPRGNSAVDRHTQLHLHDRISDSPSDEARSEEDRPRVRVLAQGLEPTRAWLARVDTLGAAGGYRDDSLTREDLVRIVEDETQSVDARLAAARVLSRRFGEAVDGLHVRVGSSLGSSLDAVLEEDADAAAERLDAQRPLFRAR